MTVLHYGETAGREVSKRIAAFSADATALRAIAEADRAHAQLFVKADDDSLWIFDSASSAGASSTVIVPDVGTGRYLKIAIAADTASFQKRTVTIGEADLTAAVNGTAQAINIGTVLPADAVVIGHEVNIATLFSGGSASAVKLDIGGTAPTAIVSQMDVFTGAATGALSPRTGAHAQGKFSAQQLVATFTPDGGHQLVNLTAGSLTITVWFHVLA